MSDLPAPRSLARLRFWLPAKAASTWLRVSVALLAAVLTPALILYNLDCFKCLLWQYDDAYITFRYAENLATGRGLVFNAGDATDSASSFLYTVVLALCYLVGAHGLRGVALVLGLASVAGTSAVVTLACLERTRRPLLALLLGVTTGCHGLLSGWAVSGMETLPFTFLVTLAVYRLFVVYAFGWLEAWVVLAILLTRYEGVLMALVWAVLAVARFVRTDREQRRKLLAMVAFVGGGFALFLAFKWFTYGTLIPHAFALKRITELYAPRPRELWHTWKSLAPATLLLAAAGLVTVPARFESWALLAFCALSVASTAVGPSAEWVRYSVHLLPLGVLLASVPLSVLWRELPVLGIAGCAFIAMEAHSSYRAIMDGFRGGRGHAECREKVGRFLEKNLAPGTLVVSSDLGAIAYRAPSIRFFDTVGLTSKDVVSGRERGLSTEPLLFAQAPTVIADTCGGRCKTPQSFSAYGWLHDSRWLTPTPEHEEYFAHLHDGKVLFRCRSPDKMWFGVTQFVHR